MAAFSEGSACLENSCITDVGGLITRNVSMSPLPKWITVVPLFVASKKANGLLIASSTKTRETLSCGSNAQTRWFSQESGPAHA